MTWRMQYLGRLEQVVRDLAHIRMVVAWPATPRFAQVALKQDIIQLEDAKRLLEKELGRV